PAMHLALRLRLRPCSVFARTTAAHRTASTEVSRVYHYYIDLHGRLFLEETKPKNMSTSLKGEKLLNGFWQRLRRNDGADSERYAFVSPCMGERNLVRPAAVPVVFHSLITSQEEPCLTYAGSLSVPFRAADLAVDEEGRLFHRLEGRLAERCGAFGLIASELSARLAETMRPSGRVGDARVELRWGNEWVPIRQLLGTERAASE
ncbi:unnamed protein product, partial [Polarella glacialis]